MVDASHSVDAGLREKVIEHLFVGELLRVLWGEGFRDMEVLRAEIDNAGHDLVVESGGILRHIQLKSSYSGARTRQVGIHTSLADKPSGCVIWIWFDPDTLNLGPFLWFGGEAGEKLPPLGERIARHSRGNSAGVKAERPNIRVLRKTRFEVVEDMEELAVRLFKGKR